MTENQTNNQEEQKEEEQPLTEEEKKIEERIKQTRKMLEWTYYGCLLMVGPALVNYLRMRRKDYFIREAKVEIRGKILRDLSRIFIISIVVATIIILYIYDI